MNTNGSLKEIPLSSIDLDDRHFKISRNKIDEDMRSSVREFGVLDPPVVIARDGLYQVVFGFNRLEVLREMGDGSTEALVVPGIDAGLYVSRTILKCLRNESGPIGRIRIHAIMKDIGVPPGRLDRIAKKCLRLPDEFTRDDTLVTLVGELPVPLKDYLDCRDIHFRIIRDLVRLPRAAHEALTAWLSYAPLRVNIFRFIVDMLSDIQTRDGDIGFVAGILPDGSIDRKQWEEHLYGRIREARYPEYSAIKKSADDIVRYFSARGIRLDYPPYFEGDRIDLTVSLARRDDPESVRKRIDDADLSKLKGLLEVL